MLRDPTNEHITRWDRAIIVLVSIFVLYNVIWSAAPLRNAFLTWNPVLLVIALVQPLLACVVFVAFSLFRIHEAIPVLINLGIPFTLGLLTLLALGAHGVVFRTINPTMTLELGLFVIFFLLVTVGIAFAVNRPNSLNYWGTVYWKIALMTFAIAWLARKPSDFSLVARVMTLCGALIGSIAIYNRLAGIDLVEGSRVTIGRDIKSALGDPNDLCLTLLFPFGFAAAMAMLKPTRTDMLIGRACAPILILSIIFTQSRGGLLGILAIAAIFGSRFIKSRAALLVVGAVCAGALFLAMGIGGRSSGGLTEWGSGDLDASAGDRMNAWRAAVRMALAKPLTGVGVLNFPENFYFYTDTWIGKAIAVHSTWLGVLAETGFVGFFVYVAMVLACLRSCLKSVAVASEREDVAPGLATTARGLLAALVGFIVAGSFLTQGFTWPPYILVGLTSALGIYTQGLSQQSSAGPSQVAPSARELFTRCGHTGRNHLRHGASSLFAIGCVFLGGNVPPAHADAPLSRSIEPAAAVRYSEDHELILEDIVEGVTADPADPMDSQEEAAPVIYPSAEV